MRLLINSMSRRLSLYMLIISLAMGGGQFLLNLADLGYIDLFILVSIVISLGLIPMLLTALLLCCCWSGSNTKISMG